MKVLSVIVLIILEIWWLRFMLNKQLMLFYIPNCLIQGIVVYYIIFYLGNLY